VDLRDRYGITQCIFNNASESDAGAASQKEMYAIAQKLGREFVLRVTGKVVERESKNNKRPTGDIEIIATKLEVLNESKTPPFLIQDDTDATEVKRMEFRYLDLRRNKMKEALLLRNRITQMVRSSLNGQEFCEIETPILIKSTPEGARDFVVPSRFNPGQFYALPQSPQTFKQILMVAGMDRYFQIVKCFRDEDLRADRQPEFTQIDCEMCFVTQEDVLSTFEKMISHVFKEVVGHTFPPFRRMPYTEAMGVYGIDKPDLRFEMKLNDLTKESQGLGFKIFDEAEVVLGMCVDGDSIDEDAVKALQAKAIKSGKKKWKRPEGKALEKLRVKNWSKKLIKNLDKLCKSSQVGAPLFWVKCTSLAEGKLKIDSSVKKNFKPEQMAVWAKKCGAKDGDLLLMFAGSAKHYKTHECMGRLRHLLGSRFGLRSKGFNALWVVDFPLLEWNEDENRYNAMHHPFTSCKEEDAHLMAKSADGSYDQAVIGKVRANAYDMVINGCEVGGGSIRVHKRDMQMKLFELLGFTVEEAKKQFGFLLGAFEYGAPPHGGLAFGLDRICMILGGGSSIRDYIAFPKNYMGRDLMIDAPSKILQSQMDELCIETKMPVSATDDTAAPPSAPGNSTTAAVAGVAKMKITT